MFGQEKIEGCFDLGDGIELTTKYLNHPLLCLGFRFQYRGKVCCTAYDTEPFQNLFITDPDDPAYDAVMAQEGAAAARDENQRLLEFFADADLLIQDAQYTQQEYDTSKPQGVRGRNADLTLVKRILNWEPKINLEEGLAKTYHWINNQVNPP